MMQKSSYSQRESNIQTTEITKKQMLELFNKGSDIQIALQTRGSGAYRESLSIQSIYITPDFANGLVDYHSAGPYSQNTYNAFLNYTLDNRFTIVRVPHINAKGTYGGLFGLPNCEIFQKGFYENYSWFATDCWEPFNDSISDVINSGEQIKARILCEEFTAITKCSIIVEHNTGGGYAIRLCPIGIPYDTGMGISNFEINSTIVRQRILQIDQIPVKYSWEWVEEKFRDIIGMTRFKNKFNEWRRDEFDVQLLRRKNQKCKKYCYTVELSQ